MTGVAVLKIAGNLEDEFAADVADPAIGQQQRKKSALFILGPPVAGKVFPHKEFLDHVMGQQQVLQLREVLLDLVAGAKPATPEDEDLLFLGGARQALAGFPEVTNALMKTQDLAILTEDPQGAVIGIEHHQVAFLQPPFPFVDIASDRNLIAIGGLLFFLILDGAVEKKRRGRQATPAIVR